MVSGFNVGLVAFVFMLILKLAHIGRRPRIAATIVLLALYCLMTGASSPVVRATVMATVFLSAYYVRREPDVYVSLSIAALFVLLPCPAQFFDIGFQLSFASVAAIVSLYPRLTSCLLPSGCKGIFRFLAEGLLVSVSAWLGTLALVACYFRLFSPVTPFANIVIVPLAALITLSGFMLIGIATIAPPLAPFFALSCELQVFLLLKISCFLARLPGACISLGH